MNDPPLQMNRFSSETIESHTYVFIFKCLLSHCVDLYNIIFLYNKDALTRFSTSVHKIESLTKIEIDIFFKRNFFIKD